MLVLACALPARSPGRPDLPQQQHPHRVRQHRNYPHAGQRELRHVRQALHRPCRRPGRCRAALPVCRDHLRRFPQSSYRRHRARHRLRLRCRHRHESLAHHDSQVRRDHIRRSRLFPGHARDRNHLDSRHRSPQDWQPRHLRRCHVERRFRQLSSAPARARRHQRRRTPATAPSTSRPSIPAPATTIPAAIVIFDPAQYKERAGLLIIGSTVYLAWASHCDFRPYTGWIMGYNITNLTQTTVLNLTPNGNEGAIWGSGAGMAADARATSFCSTPTESLTPLLIPPTSPKTATTATPFFVSPPRMG